ncbi:MAG TPA: DUF2207 domain-containing protein [bacterium]|nr:DUF2207 domain-containing protein [bacterium]HPG47379.1 DUF2207 domain-containing protein [bacterium]
MQKQLVSSALLMVLLFVVFVGAVWADKSYELVSAAIEAQILADGGMQVHESRTYRFNGSFSYAFRTLPLRKGVHYSEFRLEETDRRYLQESSERPGTFTVEDDSDYLTVRWYYRASDELRTFDFSYRIDGAIERFRDAAVLYFKFIGDDWDLPHQQVNLRVRPPASLAADEVRQWLHGPPWAFSSTEPDGSILAKCQNLPANQYLELRALYPVRLFSRMPMINREIGAQVIEEERNWAETTNRQRQERISKDQAREARHRFGQPLALGAGLAGLLGWMGIRRKHRKPNLVKSPIRLNSDIPAELPPAWASYLLNSRNVTNNALTATIFDLAQRGYLRLSEDKIRKKYPFFGEHEKSVYTLTVDRAVWQNRSGELRPFEAQVLEFLFDQLANGGDHIDLDELQAKRSKMISFFTKWQKTVKESARQQLYFEPESARGMTRGIFWSIGLIAAGIALFILFGPWLLVVSFLGFVLIFASLAIVQRTAEGERLFGQLKGLQRYLSQYHFREADRSSLLSGIDRYFVYGIVLGLSRKVFEELALLIPAEQVHRYIPWYSGHGGSFTPASFVPAFNAITSTMSSSSGSGGGASSGGGGGAGGGGGGAG